MAPGKNLSVSSFVSGSVPNRTSEPRHSVFFFISVWTWSSFFLEHVPLAVKIHVELVVQFIARSFAVVFNTQKEERILLQITWPKMKCIASGTRPALINGLGDLLVTQGLVDDRAKSIR
jgi:hypothetical protein